MSDSESDIPSDGEWDERGELAWNEFDWEKYLRGQDEILLRYLAHYETHKRHPDRIDRVADAMGWDRTVWDESGDDDTTVEDVVPEDDFDEPYTLHKNPVYVATKALCLSLRRSWELIAVDGTKVPQRLAVAYLIAVQRAEDHAMLGVQALDLGDYAMAISLYKRALSELNVLFDLLGAPANAGHRTVVAYRADALTRLFDLREIWLRVINECRDELDQPVGGEPDDAADEQT